MQDQVAVYSICQECPGWSEEYEGQWEEKRGEELARASSLIEEKQV